MGNILHSSFRKDNISKSLFPVVDKTMDETGDDRVKYEESMQLTGMSLVTPKPFSVKITALVGSD